MPILLKDKIVEIENGNILSPQGYATAGTHAGLRYARKDLGVIISEIPASSAAVYTTNQFQAAPLTVTQESIAIEGLLQAVVVNSACANACTGQRGYSDARKMRALTAEKFSIKENHVAVASTGVIGQYLDMDKIANGIQSLSPGKLNHDVLDFQTAILTTDIAMKSCGYSAVIDGKTVAIGGAAKGSGMIHPNMATMLGFLTTDAAISPENLSAALKSVTHHTFNQITVDGDTSTNDMVLVMANGLARNYPLTPEHPDWATFITLLKKTCEDLAKQIAKDGEGATKLVEVDENLMDSIYCVKLIKITKAWKGDRHMGLSQFTSEGSFERAFHQLWRASAVNKSLYQQAFLEEAAALLKEPKGLATIFLYAHLFDGAGVFAGKPWEHVRKLNPNLVRGTLHAGGLTAAAEALSNLRILAIARGDYVHPDMSANEATEFLTKVMALNLDLLLMKETEENRVKQLYKDEQASEILSFISDHCFSPLVFQSLYQEIDNLAVQRPIVTNKILKLIASAKKLAVGLQKADSNLMHYKNAVYSPSDMAASTGESYENKLKASKDVLLIREAEQLRASMQQTGLVSPFHALFLNYVSKEKPYLLQSILAADKKAKENLQSNLHFVSSLITSAITVKTRRSIYGLMRLLQRDIFTNELKEEMKKLMEVPIHDKMKSKLSAVHKVTNTDEMRSLLVSEMISILGQPLGIGQGFNPTCQSTRALSYWSQKEPVMLLAMFNQFLQHGKITMDFEGRTISSDTLPLVQLVDEIHIDTISLIFIPHLDSIYFEMLNSVKRIGQDPHKWINPAFHIKGIWTGFSDVYSDFEFKAKFRRYYHPSSNPDVNKGLPQPAGITIYNHSGQVLGAHAVLIQRVAPDPSGCIRVYFYNPNNDSLQVWGNAIRTSVAKNGEQAGESSLPFDDFLSFLYAFHFPKKFGSLI